MSDSSDPRLLALFTSRNVGTLATIKRDGRAQLSNVNHTYDAESRTLRVSTRDGLAKTTNLRRDPRASYLVATAEGYSHVVAEGTARLSPTATEPDDQVNEELVDIYRRISGGEHPDWDDFRAAMVRDRRLVLTIQIERTYGIWQG